MFVEIELYKTDREEFYKQIREINSSDEENKEGKIKEANSKFKDKIRKYLPACLNIINTTYGFKYSLYKVGKDFDASFKVIETNVKKSKLEVSNELQALRNGIDENTLTQDKKEQLDLATEILITYVDDLSNEEIEKNSILSSMPTESSSIINNIPRMSEEVVMTQINTKDEIQYNPYADVPVNFEEKKEESTNNQVIDANSFYSMDIFNNSYSGSTNNSNNNQ